MTVARRIRFGAVLVTVVLALTGFSSGHKSSGGGGCSSSKSDRSSSSSNRTTTYNRNTTRGSGSTASPTPTPTATGAPARAEVVTCAGPATSKATVRVTSLASTESTVEVPITFDGASGTVERTSGRVTLKQGETRTIEIPLSDPTKAAAVTGCRLGTVVRG
ncbi:hypothetical protein AB0N28_24920 [Streptomyces sp. NPDC051130]|uniref:hypothetical protein n=1 Tax=Streptomyces sp. NPDC051130 TaxID=3157223 RepID=UPI003423429A